jgi:hypothetical protein
MKKPITTVLIATAIIATLAVASTSALAVMDKTAANAQGTGKTAAITTASNPQQGNIEYAKKTLFNPNGSTASVEETWADPATQAEKVNYSEPIKETGEINYVAGAYALENGARYIKVSRDSLGNLIGYEMKSSNHNLSDILTASKQDYINEYKEGTRRAGWNDKGLVQSADGKQLDKLSRTDDASMMPGEEGTAYTENVYLDPSSGLPVIGDISVVKNGTSKLLYTYVYEYKNVSDNGTIFDTSGIKINKM